VQAKTCSRSATTTTQTSDNTGELPASALGGDACDQRKIAESRTNPGILRPTSLSAGRHLGNSSRNGRRNQRFDNLKITKFDIQQNSAIPSKQRSKDLLLSAIIFISPVIGLAVQ
jgi:hypothetical protein